MSQAYRKHSEVSARSQCCLNVVPMLSQCCSNIVSLEAHSPISIPISMRGMMWSRRLMTQEMAQENERMAQEKLNFVDEICLESFSEILFLGLIMLFFG